MPEVFDLSKIKALIENERPSAVVIIDTNIILDESDFDHWKTNLEKPLFVLPCMVHFELAHLKNKPESSDDASSATQNIAQLCHDGRISEGITRKETGLFISVPMPERKARKATLERLSALTKVFGQADTEIAILARQLSDAVPQTPVIIATSEKNLYHAIKFMGLESHLFKGFPMKFDRSAARAKTQKALNWDEVLEGIQSDSQKKTVQVELTLTSKGRAPNWLSLFNSGKGKVPVIIAEGSGIIHAISDIPFAWYLPLIPWDFPESTAGKIENIEPEVPAALPLEPSITPGKSHLDFRGTEHTVSPTLQELLIKKLNNCASPMAYVEDMPTVQEPIAVMKQFFLFEYVFQDHEFQKQLPREKLEAFENKLKTFNNLLNWAFFWLYDREGTKENLNISFGEFMHALRSCWSIGDTIRIDLIEDQAES